MCDKTEADLEKDAKAVINELATRTWAEGAEALQSFCAKFVGWYDEASARAEKVKEVIAGVKDHAIWSEVASSRAGLKIILQTLPLLIA